MPITRGTSGALPHSRQKHAVNPAVRKSSPTMMRPLWTRSAAVPPMGPMRIMGRKEQAFTTPNRVMEPVSRSRYRGRAKWRMALPNREMICPMTTRVKSRVKKALFLVSIWMLLSL